MYYGDSKPHIAPDGQVYVCGACGRTARDKYNGPRGWDESCMLNAVLCYLNPEMVDGQSMWRAVEESGGEKERNSER